MSTLDVSVVIGFRDWGAERIRRSAQSIVAAFDGIAGEVIISDYGSQDPRPTEVVAQELGAKHVFTPGDPDWSRSRALNAGFAVAEGKVLISTDADMLFSPKSIRRIVETAQEAEQCALFLQCRDLPESMGDDYFEAHPEVDWNELEIVGRLRPRWGMGGMMAISAEGFAAIRGFDERLHTYGGEDLDFAQRARRAGYRTVWVDDPDVRMYHMWHVPTRSVVDQTEAGRAAVAYNKDVVYNDKTYTRNTTGWKFKPENTPPLVSVVFATKDRADLLREAIQSVLIQTVQDFEIIIVDDGSEDDSTRAVAQSFGDERIRYFRREAAGISAARNFALDQGQGYYTAVMDDDDLMPPQRLEWQLAAVTAEYVGSTGSFINFDDETGELQVIISNVPSVAQAAQKGGAPGHGTWLLRTDVMRTIRYDETLTSGVDNNFFLRLLRTGYRVSHCGKPVLLRRRHSLQVTATDSANQGDAAKQALQFFRFGLTNWHMKKLADAAKVNAFPPVKDRDEFARSVHAYLPDHLVTRNATVQVSSLPKRMPEFDGEVRGQLLSRDGVLLSSHMSVKGASYGDLVKLAALGTRIEAQVATAESTSEESHSAAGWVTEALADFLTQTPQGSTIRGNKPTLEAEPQAGVGSEYVFEDSRTRRKLVLTHESAVNSLPETTPWFVVGTTVKEYWS
ncbi:glycosyltransferase family 2 protein [Gulosibacter sediminis]|uniref:glycosyltransferase family 2 protein n=1 Tax=Gulosibacter sediminis TaxID=1729695 RepID=UPI001868563F|nr:glycosyltransferase [Gulosibacter sediminis]